MGVVNTIVRSADDIEKPKHKSYGGYLMAVELVDHKKISEKIKLLPSEKRLVAHELSGREPVKEVIVIKNVKKSLGRLTTSQIRDIFDDLGFNVDPILSKPHFSDLEAVMNIGGYSIPGWVRIARLVSRLFPSREKLLLLKLSPGKDRLHVRIFEMNDGSWMIIAHTDFNWMSLNLPKIYRAHINSGGPVGSGDYITGTIMMYKLLQKFSVFTQRNQILRYEDIEIITRWAYNESIAQKLSKLISYS